MINFLEKAKEIEQETISNRRAIHGFAEIGFDLPNTVAFVTEKLKEYGYTPLLCGKSGITCTVGKGKGKTILLRGDMDALPMTELSGECYAAQNGHCHSCGHDCHTAMLLSVAKILKQYEQELEGTVKFMFQPAEELLSGAKDMIDAGILENPKVDAAFAMHVMPGLANSHSGHILYSRGSVTSSGDSIRIEVTGVDAHGSKANLGVDAIHIAAHIVIALQEIIAREIPSAQDGIITVGKISGGTTVNSIAGKAVLEVCVRAENQNAREFLIKRVGEVSTGIAATFRGSVAVIHEYGSPALWNNTQLVDQVVAYAKELLPEETILEMGKMGGGEDFTFVANAVPSAFFVLGAGSLEEGYTESVHNPKTKFDENILKIGVAAYAQIAYRYLKDTKLL